IVSSLVRRQGGSIKAESPGEGKGTTFTVELPMMAIEESKSAGNPLKSQTKAVVQGNDGRDQRLDLAGLRVLVVDDETDALDLISVVLKQYGAEVQTATSAGAALILLSQWRPNVL